MKTVKGIKGCRSLTNAQEGVILTAESDVFGNIQSQTGTGSTNYHLTTKELDPDTGLYYFIARWYDPVEGRFISQDPVPEANLYWYVRNNPVNYTDSTGEFAWIPFICLCVYIAGEIAYWICLLRDEEPLRTPPPDGGVPIPPPPRPPRR